MSTITNRTTPIGLVNYAKDFFDCAIIADEHMGQQPGYEIIAPIPVMYLAGHSIELCLKAYLLFKEVPYIDLKSKKYGHDLTICLDKANELGLCAQVYLTDGEYIALSALNNLYSTTELSYIKTGEKEFPVFGPIQSVCSKLLNAIYPLVNSDDKKQQDYLYYESYC